MTQPPRLSAPADITLADLSALTTEQRIAVYRRLLALPGVVTGPLRERLVAVVASHDIVEAYADEATHDADAAEARVPARPGPRWSRVLDRVLGPGMGAAFGETLHERLRERAGVAS